MLYKDPTRIPRIDIAPKYFRVPSIKINEPKQPEHKPKKEKYKNYGI